MTAREKKLTSYVSSAGRPVAMAVPAADCDVGMRERRVLFLDVDGVLNSVRWFKARGKFRREDGRPFWQHDIDPAAVTVLEEIVRAAECEIVLSSTWRLLYPLDALSDFFATLGLSRRLVGKTPEWHTRPPGHIVGTYPTRGREIEAWLDAQPTRPTSIAIIDDDADMGDLMPWLVQTDAEEGLTRAHANRVVDAFSRSSPPQPASSPPVGEGRPAAEAEGNQKVHPQSRSGSARP